MGRILSDFSYQLTLVTDLRDLQDRIPTSKPGSIASVQAINYFVWKTLYY